MALKNSEQMKGPSSSRRLGKILTLDTRAYSSVLQGALLGAGAGFIYCKSQAHGMMDTQKGHRNWISVEASEIRKLLEKPGWVRDAMMSSTKGHCP